MDSTQAPPNNITKKRRRNDESIGGRSSFHRGGGRHHHSMNQTQRRGGKNGGEAMNGSRNTAADHSKGGDRRCNSNAKARSGFGRGDQHQHAAGRHSGNKHKQHSWPSNTMANSSTDSFNVVSNSSSEHSSLLNSEEMMASTPAAPASLPSSKNKTITKLAWPNPHTHYIPIEEETRMLPALIHWGQSERGMMKDQPAFRLQKIERVLGSGRGKSTEHGSRHGKHCSSNGYKANKQSNNNTTLSPRISLIQSLSLRRHHLKLLNPNLSMTALRLGQPDNIRDAADLFEDCVESYLKRHNVQYWSEEEQRKQFEESGDSNDRRRKQPPTPDFMMKDGHCVMLSFTDDVGNDCATSTANQYDNGFINFSQINWIEAKMVRRFSQR